MVFCCCHSSRCNQNPEKKKVLCTITRVSCQVRTIPLIKISNANYISPDIHKPKVVYCNKCWHMNHFASKCTKRWTMCGKCSSIKHTTDQCTAAPSAYICPRCPTVGDGGRHAAWSRDGPGEEVQVAWRRVDQMGKVQNGWTNPKVWNDYETESKLNIVQKASQVTEAQIEDLTATASSRRSSTDDDLWESSTNCGS